MSHLFYFICYSIIFCSLHATAQKKWDGGAGNNQWSNPLNWSGNTLPLSTDDVLLDHSLVGTNYNVTLPNTTVTVRTISITPAAGKTINLLLPSTNTLVPGFIATGSRYGLVVNTGGTFRNASGATSGNSVWFADSIKINGTGRYIHNTSSSHSTNVQVLSAAPGTEQGIFELDIPLASSTISLSGRTFGRLVLTSVAARGACNYTAVGTSRVNIRNALELGAGVNLSLNFSDTIAIAGDLIQSLGTLNLGNSTRSVVVKIGQNLTQSVGGIITETGTGIQSLYLSGAGVQLVSIRGSIQNQVAFVKAGEGIALLKNVLSLPYKLSLKAGRIISSSLWLLHLQPACTVEADSLSVTGFVDGPMKKDGLNRSGFLFPVGKTERKRWIRLENASGSFTVEYFKVDPYTLTSEVGTGLHHVSRVEYWDILSTADATATVKLSFDNPHSGGVTNLSSLRVAKLVNGKWENAGNALTSGNPGSDGWVSSIAAGGFSASNKSFALASAISQENPLPLMNMSFHAVTANQRVHFSWRVADQESGAGVFELQESEDGKSFVTFHSMIAEVNRKAYSYLYMPTHMKKYYRIRFRSEHSGDGLWYESDIVQLPGLNSTGMRLLGSNIVNSSLQFGVTVKRTCSLSFGIFDMSGRIIKYIAQPVSTGSSLIRLDVSRLAKGLYVLREINGTMNIPSIRFIKD